MTPPLSPAAIPLGWAAFPQKDVLSDEPGAIDADVINICKGGQSEDDLLSKPFVRIDYYGPGEEMSGGLKDWYSQTEDLAPLQCGPYTWEGFTTTDYDLMAVLCAAFFVLSIKYIMRSARKPTPILGISSAYISSSRIF